MHLCSMRRAEIYIGSELHVHILTAGEECSRFEKLLQKRVLISRSAASLWSERFCIASACSRNAWVNNAFREHVM